MHTSPGLFHVICLKQLSNECVLLSTQNIPDHDTGKHFHVLREGVLRNSRTAKRDKSWDAATTKLSDHYIRLQQMDHPRWFCRSESCPARLFLQAVQWQHFRSLATRCAAPEHPSSFRCTRAVLPDEIWDKSHKWSALDQHFASLHP
jgi:hypothetical protein